MFFFGQATFDADTLVSGITTQGRGDAAQWVTSFTLEYSADDGATYTSIQKNGADVVFNANFDQNTQVYTALPTNIVATNLRLNVVTSQGAPSLRWQLYGCYTKGTRDCNSIAFTPGNYARVHEHTMSVCPQNTKMVKYRLKSSCQSLTQINMT